jgi:thiamine pyrophosphate-dependent acetolactate synthase large subunit-like protein
MKKCDTFLMVGSAFPYSEFLPKPGAARGVQIDIDGSRLSLRYPMEVNIVGDSATTLGACCRSSSRRITRRGAGRLRRACGIGGAR